MFANEAERDALGELDGTPLVLKRGARGIVADGREWPAAPAEASSTRPARATRSPPATSSAAPSSALAAAARCVAQLGAMP